MTKEAFGNDSNGSRSGYDFVKHEFVWSFNEQTFGPHTDGTEANIDMVEHSGLFGKGGNTFGFTSGVSSIWNGEIKGNGTTKWVKAPATFEYSSATTVHQLRELYTSLESSTAINIQSIAINGVYLGRVRGGDEYVAMHCTSLKTVSTPPSGGRNDNIYFDFEYKHGKYITAINEELSKNFSIYPNPANSIIELSLESNTQKISTIAITDLNGRSIRVENINNRIDVSALPQGIYVLSIITNSGEAALKRFVKL